MKRLLSKSRQRWQTASEQRSLTNGSSSTPTEVQESESAGLGATIFIVGCQSLFVLIFSYRYFLEYALTPMAMGKVSPDLFTALLGFTLFNAAHFYTWRSDPGQIVSSTLPTSEGITKFSEHNGVEMLGDLGAENNKENDRDQDQTLIVSAALRRGLPPENEIHPETRERWCRVCCMWAPVRSKHCNKCQRCIPRYDHHCHFVDCCIGARNHRRFFVMLLIETWFLWVSTWLSWSFLVASAVTYLTPHKYFHFSERGTLYTGFYDPMHPPPGGPRLWFYTAIFFCAVEDGPAFAYAAASPAFIQQHHQNMVGE